MVMPANRLRVNQLYDFVARPSMLDSQKYIKKHCNLNLT